MTKKDLLRFPDEFKNYYSEKLGEWQTDVEYYQLFNSNFMKLLSKKDKEMIGIVFSSKVLGSGDDYALMYVPVAIHDGDAQIRGIKHIGTYKSPPYKSPYNEAYINMITYDELLLHPYRNKLYIGTTDKMKDIKEIRQAWAEGLINPTGSLPDYDYVEMF
mgnify:CR=1 FL=1